MKSFILLNKEDTFKHHSGKVITNGILWNPTGASCVFSDNQEQTNTDKKRVELVTNEVFDCFKNSIYNTPARSSSVAHIENLFNSINHVQHIVNIKTVSNEST